MQWGHPIHSVVEAGHFARHFEEKSPPPGWVVQPSCSQSTGSTWPRLPPSGSARPQPLREEGGTGQVLERQVMAAPMIDVDLPEELHPGARRQVRLASGRGLLEHDAWTEQGGVRG